MASLLAGACGGGNDGAEGTDTPDATSHSFDSGSTMASIIERGKLVVGVKFDVPLFGLRDPVSRQLDGFDVALAREIAREMGLSDAQIEFVEAVSADRIPLLDDDRVDIIVSTMTINAQRKEQVEFSRPYYVAGQSILVLKSTMNINGLGELTGKKVCAAKDSTSEQNIAARAPQAELLPLLSYSACVAALKDGRVDAVSTDDIILAGFAAADNTLKLVGGQFTSEPYGVAVKKGKTDMAAFISEVLGAMIADGRWDKLYNQYLGNVGGLPSAADARSRLPATP